MSALKQRLTKLSSQGHQFLVLLFALPLFISATTGIAHRLGRSWFGLSKDFGRAMMTLHEGRYLGEWGVPLYVLVIGLGLLGIIATGLGLLWGRSLPAQWSARRLHHLLAALAALPLLVSATTGMAYRLGRNWFGLSKEQAAIFLSLHQGTYWGEVGRPFYVLLVGLSLLTLLATGLSMLTLLRRLSLWRPRITPES
ncbi:PepSY domain-containing protein [Thermosynechococcus sp.]|uniref:PepSY domain-containing protein n=1 Tax=Thermosynechococcus sp. TaxID=2814275 RepID=UPI003919BB47